MPVNRTYNLLSSQALYLKLYTAYWDLHCTYTKLNIKAILKALVLRYNGFPSLKKQYSEELKLAC